MGTAMENSFLRLRVRHLVETYPDQSVLADCDCTSTSYFVLSVVLLTLGTCITVSALGATEHVVFSHLGHMWLVGPICICCGTMVAIKSVLYLRRKSLIKMLLRQRALLRSLQEMTAQTRGPAGGGEEMTSAPSTLTLPPAYDLIVAQGVSANSPEPPPTYAEAMRLFEQDKANTTAASHSDEQDSADKEIV